MRVSVCPSFSWSPKEWGPLHLLRAPPRCRSYDHPKGAPIGPLLGAVTGLLRCFPAMPKSSLFAGRGVGTTRGFLPPASATGGVSIHSFRQADVQDALARIEELHLRGMYGFTGPWRRLLQRINANFQAVKNMGEGALLSLVSAVSASLHFTACPSPEAHLLAANVLQALAADPTAEAATAAASCSDATRLRLLLLLQPLIATHPEKNFLCSLKVQAFQPLRVPCVHALQAAASAGNSELQAAAAAGTGVGVETTTTAAAAAPAAGAAGAAVGAVAAAARGASLLAAVSADPFGVLHLLLGSIEARGPAEEQQTLLGALADAAMALLPLVKEENVTRAAFVCARLLLMKRQASQTNNHSESQQEHTQQGSSQAPDTYASSLTSTSTSSSSSRSSRSRNDCVGLEVLTLRSLLRAPLPTASASQVEEASTALWMMRKTLLCGKVTKPLVLTAEGGEAEREAQEHTAADKHAAATLSLLSAAETHVSQALVGRAASLEPKEVLQVVAAVSTCTTAALCSSSSSSTMWCNRSSSKRSLAGCNVRAELASPSGVVVAQALQSGFFGNCWLANVIKRGCNLKGGLAFATRDLESTTVLILPILNMEQQSGKIAHELIAAELDPAIFERICEQDVVDLRPEEKAEVLAWLQEKAAETKANSEKRSANIHVCLCRLWESMRDCSRSRGSLDAQLDEAQLAQVYTAAAQKCFSAADFATAQNASVGFATRLILFKKPFKQEFVHRKAGYLHGSHWVNALRLGGALFLEQKTQGADVALEVELESLVCGLDAARHRDGSLMPQQVCCLLLNLLRGFQLVSSASLVLCSLCQVACSSSAVDMTHVVAASADVALAHRFLLQLCMEHARHNLDLQRAHASAAALADDCFLSTHVHQVHSNDTKKDKGRTAANLQRALDTLTAAHQRDSPLFLRVLEHQTVLHTETDDRMLHLLDFCCEHLPVSFCRRALDLALRLALPNPPRDNDGGSEAAATAVHENWEDMHNEKAKGFRAAKDALCGLYAGLKEMNASEHLLDNRNGAKPSPGYGGFKRLSAGIHAGQHEEALEVLDSDEREGDEREQTRLLLRLHALVVLNRREEALKASCCLAERKRLTADEAEARIHRSLPRKLHLAIASLFALRLLLKLHWSACSCFSLLSWKQPPTNWKVLLRDCELGASSRQPSPEKHRCSLRLLYVAAFHLQKSQEDANPRAAAIRPTRLLSLSNAKGGKALQEGQAAPDIRSQHNTFSDCRLLRFQEANNSSTHNTFFLTAAQLYATAVRCSTDDFERATDLFLHASAVGAAARAASSACPPATARETRAEALAVPQLATATRALATLQNELRTEPVKSKAVDNLLRLAFLLESEGWRLLT
ncbi:hypothetical protein Esti_006557 [Eimeria stiedai]